MSKNLIKILSIVISLCLILEQGVFAQTIDLSHYFARNPAQTIPQSDKFRPLHLRYISYDNQANDFKILLDKGDAVGNGRDRSLQEATQELMKYFFIGLSLPNEKFWVNLRPDSQDNILDPDLEKTDIGRIFLEADLQLKKDTSGMTSSQTKEGREYWDKLYKKVGELFGTENITIPTITRPWIVPNEIIIREAPDNAYIYKATLKVMLEEDYLTSRGGSRTAPTYQQYAFSDPRLKELNEYSTQLIRESIIPKLTYAVNTAKRYAALRQVYYSLILAQWFKQKYGSSGSARASGIRAPVNNYIDLIDSGNLVNLASSQPYDRQSYFRQYQKSFQDGEYNLQEPVYTPMGQSIRRYVSGGIIISKASPTIIPGQRQLVINSDYLVVPNISVASSSISLAEQLVKGIFDKYNPHLSSYPIKVHCLNMKDELISDLISGVNNLQLKMFSNQEKFFTIMMELIGNAIKHGEGQPVKISFQAEEGNLIVKVQDYGKGIDFKKLSDLLRNEAGKGLVQKHGYLKGVPTAIGKSDILQPMSLEEVEAFIENAQSEIPFVVGLSTDEGRMRIGGAGLYLSRVDARHLGGDLTYETSPKGSIFTVRLPISSLTTASSAVEKKIISDAEKELTRHGLLMHGYNPGRAGGLNDTILLKKGIRSQVSDGGRGYGADQAPAISVGITLWGIWGNPYPLNKAFYYARIFDAPERRGRVYVLGIKEKFVKNLERQYGSAVRFDDRGGEGLIYLPDGNYLSPDFIEGIIANVADKESEIERIRSAGLNRPVRLYLVDDIFKGAKVQAEPELVEVWDVNSPLIPVDSLMHPATDTHGGIDFAALPIQTQTMPGVSSVLTSHFQLPTSISIPDLDAEWSQIQAVFNAGIRPSIQRLSEYTAAAAASPLAGERIDQVRVMLADILRRDEESERPAPAEEPCKQLLRALELR